ncbi:MAG: hypothetical protein R3195_18945 [Gemmatimonadota bacterium]|nr:hypothetical protein [Gemmatimonadota bacterium]
MSRADGPSKGPGLARRGLVEFVVIVIGVLVALGLESWWQGRQDQALALEYAEALKDEARTGSATIETVSLITALKRQWLERARSIVEAGLVEDSAAMFLEGSLQGSGIPVVPQISNAVFEDLQSTGRLGLFRDASTRTAIIAGHAYIEAMLERQDLQNANVDSRLHALAIRHAPARAVRQDGPRINIDAGAVPASELRAAARALAADPAFEGELRAAFRVIEQEENVLAQLALAFEDQLAVLERRERPRRRSARDFADSLGLSTSGSTDSAESR